MSPNLNRTHGNPTRTQVRHPGQRSQTIFQSRASFLTGGSSLADYVGGLTAERRRNRYLGQPGPWADIAWLTPIVGSGPLGLPTLFLDRSDGLAAEVVGQLLKHAVFETFQGVGADEAKWLYHFAAAMISQRVGGERNVRPVKMMEDVWGEVINSPPAARGEDTAALMVLVSAQLTRAFHRISLDTCRPISRWGSEQASMPADHDRRVPLYDEYIALLTHAIELALESLELARRRDPSFMTADTASALAKLLQAIKQNANDRTVTVLQLQQITEISWHLLVDSVVRHAYPGWTDLLLRLVLDSTDGVTQGHTRPRWSDLERVADQVRSIIEPAARASWLQLDDHYEEVKNRRFYNSLADSLWAQHRARESWYRLEVKGNQGTDLPFPLAFVTSFDFELEAALWRTADDAGGSFTVVVPAYFMNGHDSLDADFVWLEGEVRVPPRAQRQDLTSSQFDDVVALKNWRLVHGRRDDLERRPVVVRLCGCPLIELPKRHALGGDPNPSLWGDVAKAQRLSQGGVHGDAHFIHAVTVDEYLALRQTEAEWLWSREGQTTEREVGGLPPLYFAAKQNGPQRFWMLLGVPFRDPAVRIRIMSILTRYEGVEDRASTVVESYDVPAALPPSAAQQVSPEPSRPAAPTIVARSWGGGLVAIAGDDTRQRPAPPDDASAEAPVEVSLHQEAETDPAFKQMDVTAVVSREGVAVNTRIDDEEANLLAALGFFVVKDQCEDFTDDLTGYADYIAAVSSRALVAKDAKGENSQ